MNKFLRKLTVSAVAVMLSASMAVTAGAWSEDPAASETEAAETTTAAETTAPETEAETTAAETTTEAETTTTTTAPEAVLDDEPVETEAPVPEETEPETAPPETEAPAETTTTAAATQAVANTAAPDSYSAVEPFEMYVPEVLNVRGGPGTNYDKLGQVYANNTIKIIGTSGDWYVFDYFGNDGYLLAELLQEVPETTTTTAAPEDAPAEDTSEDTTTVPDDDMVIEPDVSDTAPAENEPVIETTPSTEDDESPAGAGTVDIDENDSSGFPPVLLALICGIAAFLLIGVVPILVHKAHHKKLYQY